MVQICWKSRDRYLNALASERVAVSVGIAALALLAAAAHQLVVHTPVALRAALAARALVARRTGALLHCRRSTSLQPARLFTWIDRRLQIKIVKSANISTT